MYLSPRLDCKSPEGGNGLFVFVDHRTQFSILQTVILIDTFDAKDSLAPTLDL